MVIRGVNRANHPCLSTPVHIAHSSTSLMAWSDSDCVAGGCPGCGLWRRPWNLPRVSFQPPGRWLKRECHCADCTPWPRSFLYGCHGGGCVGGATSSPTMDKLKQPPNWQIIPGLGDKGSPAGRGRGALYSVPISNFPKFAQPFRLQLSDDPLTGKGFRTRGSPPSLLRF